MARPQDDVVSSRETVLGKVRRAVGGGDDASRRAAVSERLANHPCGIVPKKAGVSGEAGIEQFCKAVESVHGSVARLPSRDAVPAEVSEYLRRHNLPSRLRRGGDERLTTLPWQEQAPNLEISTGPSDGADLVSVSHADAGMAESGTVVLTSGDANPTTLNFLPDTHIVVLDVGDLVGGMEDVWSLLRNRNGEALPRTVNLITGPSRSGDIEQTLLLGAHGPRRLHVILVG